MSRYLRLLGALPLGLFVVAAYFGCGDDPVKSRPVPVITEFSAYPVDIMPGDSSLLTYTVTNASRTTLTPDGSDLSPAGSGQVYVKPAVPTTYVLQSFNDDGQDSDSLTITMTGAMPRIDQFSLTPDTILLADSTLLSWTTTRTDSLVINAGIGKVGTASSGSQYLHPTTSTAYLAIAYNNIGTDTAEVTSRVEAPETISAELGLHYKGTMGGGLEQPLPNFFVSDNDGVPLTLPLINFTLAAGDGTIEIDSAVPGSDAVVVNDYAFDGDLGYGVIRAMVRDIDTIDVNVRASVLRFGTDAQGQYIRASDLYSDVLALNGTPEQVDNDPTYWLNYAVYESALGLVLVVEDDNQDLAIQESEPVHEIIVNSLFSEVSPEGVGLGSTIATVRSAFGATSSEFYDPGDAVNDPTWVLVYNDIGALFYCDRTAPDSSVVEIHFSDIVSGGTAASKTAGLERTETGSYRAHR